MEYRDLLDKNRKPTGEKIAKNQPLPDGRYICVIIAVIQDSQGRLLLQKRSPDKGGKWAFTGGHPQSGQSSLEGAVCEIKEELGVTVGQNDLKLFKTIKTDKTFVDLYYLKKDLQCDKLTLQREEVQDAKWFTQREAKTLVATNQFFDKHYDAFEAFLENQETLFNCEK